MHAISYYALQQITVEMEAPLSTLNWLDELLEPSNLKNKAVFDYVKDKCQTIDPSHIDDLTNNFYKGEDNNHYILNEEDESEILNIISALTEEQVLTLTKRKHSHFLNQRKTIEETFYTFQHNDQVFLGLMEKDFAIIILYIINLAFNYSKYNGIFFQEYSKKLR